MQWLHLQSENLWQKKIRFGVRRKNLVPMLCSVKSSTAKVVYEVFPIKDDLHQYLGNIIWFPYKHTDHGIGRFFASANVAKLVIGKKRMVKSRSLRWMFFCDQVDEYQKKVWWFSLWQFLLIHKITNSCECLNLASESSLTLRNLKKKLCTNF